MSLATPWYLADYDVEGAYFDTEATALDLETTNLERGSALVPGNRIVLACAGRDGAYRIDSSPRTLVPLRGVLVAHNAKFELSWLNRIGMDTSQLLPWDTLLAEYVIQGNRRVPLDLGSVSRKYGFQGKEPVIDSLMGGGVCPSKMPEHLLKSRVLRDTETTERIFKIQRDNLRELGLLGVMFTRCIFSPVLADIEATGICVDKALVKEETRKVLGELRAIEAEMNAMTGGINPRSVPQMAKYLYETLGFRELTDRRGAPKRNAPSKQFPAGVPLTDADTLDKLEAETEDQKKFLKIRGRFGEVNARYTKTLQFLEAIANDYGGIMYGRFNQAVTQTHRLSSSGRKIPITNPETGKVEEKGIQFQNLPREYKRLFTVRDPDYVFVDIDGSQLEFRVAAFLGQDKVAAKDIVQDADIHRFTASVIYNVPEDEVTKTQRTNAKPNTFKPLYGGNSGTKREVAYYEAFREKYKGVYNTQKGWVTEVLKSKDKSLKTVTGLRFYYPGTKITSSGYVENTPSIFNYPVQSLATADIIPISTTLLYWRTYVTGLRVRFVNSVHDSVAIECHKDDVERLKALAEECFLEGTYRYLDEVYGIKMNVPLGLSFSAASHWGNGDEIKVSRPYSQVKQLIEVS